MCECHLGAGREVCLEFRPPCVTPGPRPVDNLGSLLKAVTESLPRSVACCKSQTCLSMSDIDACWVNEHLVAGTSPFLKTKRTVFSDGALDIFTVCESLPGEYVV